MYSLTGISMTMSCSFHFFAINSESSKKNVYVYECFMQTCVHKSFFPFFMNAYTQRYRRHSILFYQLKFFTMASYVRDFVRLSIGHFFSSTNILISYTLYTHIVPLFSPYCLQFLHYFLGKLFVNISFVGSIFNRYSQ